MSGHTCAERVYSLITTRGGGLEIELGPSFCDTDAADLVAAVAALSAVDPRPNGAQGKTVGG